PSEAAVAHSVDHRPAHVEAGPEIGVDHRLPVVDTHPVHGGVAGDTGIVDQDIDRPQVGLDPLHAFAAGLEIAHIPPIGGDAGTRREFLRPLFVPGIVCRYGVACVLQGGADRLADAASPAGHKCHAPHRLTSCISG